MPKILLIILLTANVAVAQEPDYPTVNWNVGFYGNALTNPGLFAGFDWGVSEKTLKQVKIRRNREKTSYKTNRLEVSPGVGIFFDPGSQMAVFGSVSVTYRRFNNRNGYYHFGVGIGHLTSFLRNSYDVVNGTVQPPKTINYQYLAPTTSLKFGKIRKKEGNFTGLYVGISSQFLLDYNGGILPLPAVEFGRIF